MYIYEPRHPDVSPPRSSSSWFLTHTTSRWTIWKTNWFVRVFMTLATLGHWFTLILGTHPTFGIRANDLTPAQKQTQKKHKSYYPLHLSNLADI